MSANVLMLTLDHQSVGLLGGDGALGGGAY